MYDLRNGDVVITSKAIKDKILKYLSSNRKILNIKILSIKEFKDNYFGTYDEQAIYYLMKKYNYRYEIAKKYLDNFYFDDALKYELEENNLLVLNNLFKKRLDRIVVINIKFLDPYIKDILDKYDVIYYEEDIFINEIEVREFDIIDDEISYVFTEIIDRLNEISLDRIHLVNISSEYIEPIKRLSKVYNLPINLDFNRNIYSNLLIQKFIHNLKETRNMEESLELINDADIYDFVLEICNKYVFTELDDLIIECIIYEIKNSNIVNKTKNNGIDVIEIDDICNDNDYYYVLGFNETILPKIYKDEDFFSDLKKKEFGLLTSEQKNTLEKNTVLKKLSNYPNIFISYKLKTPFSSYYPSSVISEYNFKVIKDSKIKYNYSNLYNKLKLSSMLDKLVKYNEFNDDINVLFSTYSDLNYQTYDNKFKGIKKEDFFEYIGDKLLLSYSSIDNFSKCGFRFYIKNILKLDQYEEKFTTYIGNLFHYILSQAFQENFDFDKEYEKYTLDKELNDMEIHFVDKLKNDLKFIITEISKQNNNSILKKELYEKKFFIEKKKEIKVSFMGVIDKIKYDNDTLALIDYKTGNPIINLNNVIYGLDMQLPIYLYLIKHSEFKNFHIAGFYLQKILPIIPTFDIGKDENDEKTKALRLEGYSNDNTDILEKLDNTFNDSQVIKSLKMSSKGFYAYSKVLTDEQINNLIKIVDKKIDNIVDEIIDTKFDINPKQIDFDLKGCEFCEFRDLCFRKEKDIVKLKSHDIDLGGE